MPTPSNDTQPNRTIKFGEFTWALIKFMLFKLPGILLNMRNMTEPDKTGRSNIGKYLEKNSVKYAKRPALIFEDQQWNWNEFNKAVNQYANYFLSTGLKKGDVFVVFMENRPDMLFIIAAAAKIVCQGSGLELPLFIGKSYISRPHSCTFLL